MTKKTSVQEEVLDFMRSGGNIETRLREASNGDIEFLQRGILDIPSNVDATERELIHQLHVLEERGRIEALYLPHPFAADEFVVRWKPT